MKIRVGYEITYDCPKPTPMLLVLSVHPSRQADLLRPHPIVFDPPIASTGYHDSFGNICTRILAPAGTLKISSDQIVADPGTPDVVAADAEQHAVEHLPEETLVFLLGSRYCETDRLSDAAWSLFGTVPPGWQRVQSICDFVYNHIRFGYEHARPTKSAWDAYMERNGVCRDFAHLAVTFCRCMNIPARYCTGYLGDIGVPSEIRRWISAPGSRPISGTDGTPSTRGTTIRASDGLSWRAGATPPTSRSARHSAPAS